MKKPWVKICGITRSEDALLAESLGADALGFILFANSPRFVEAARIAEIVQSLPTEAVSRVGVFVNPTLSFVEEVLSQAPLSHLQFHGNESPEFCSEVRALYPHLKIIKALRLNSPEADLSFTVDFELFDHQSGAQWGGTGQTISWQQASERRASTQRPFILAGGLNPANVAQALREVEPFGIDLSSGVEDTPGIKSETKLRALFHEIELFSQLETP